MPLVGQPGDAPTKPRTDRGWLVLMRVQRLHPDEADINEALIRRLLVSQMPQWAELPLHLVEPQSSFPATGISVICSQKCLARRPRFRSRSATRFVSIGPRPRRRPRWNRLGSGMPIISSTCSRLRSLLQATASEKCLATTPCSSGADCNDSKLGGIHHEAEICA